MWEEQFVALCTGLELAAITESGGGSSKEKVAMELLKEHSSISQQRYDVLLNNLAAMKMQYKEERQASSSELHEMTATIAKLNKKL